MLAKHVNLHKRNAVLVLVLILIAGNASIAQERQEVYFHKRFTKRVDTSKLSLEKYVRSYEKLDSSTIKVVDYTQLNRSKYGRKKLRESVYTGLSDFLEVDRCSTPAFIQF